MPEREREGASGSGGTPACQRDTTSPAGGPRPVRPEPARTRHAVGRTLATPTFLAGACIVIVATLAYGTTQTHLLYSQPTCQSARCSTPGGHGNRGVTLKTTARPGVGRQHAPAPKKSPVHEAGGALPSPGGGSSASPHTGAPSGQSAPPPPVSVGGGQPGPKVAILFNPTRTWRGGFTAVVTIANRGRSALDGWQLWLRYRSSEIRRVWGARWFPGSAKARNVGLVAAPASQPKVRPGSSERFTFTASGVPSAPLGCLFDGYHCSFKGLAGGGLQAGGGHHSQKPAPKNKTGL